MVRSATCISMLELLPTELLYHIVSLLNATDLLALASTSHRFNELVAQPRLWYNLLGDSGMFEPDRGYREEYAWRHGHLAVDVRSDLAPKNEELFGVLTFFPLHRCYKGKELATLSPAHLPWATEDLASHDGDLLVLSCRQNGMIVHVHHESTSISAVRHELLILRADCEPRTLHGLPDWPLCATFIGDSHVLVAGRFPALLIWDLNEAVVTPTGVPLSSHTINCLSLSDVKQSKSLLLCGHYKGRGSMELLEYSFSEAKLHMHVKERNRFAGITTIVSCAYLPGGSFMTYDNYSHIYLWSSLNNAVRKIDHDGIGDEIPSEMIYKMFYMQGQLVFIDQYKRQHAFVIRPGRSQIKQTARSRAERSMEDEVTDQSIKSFLLRQDHDMTSLTRRVLGI